MIEIPPLNINDFGMVDYPGGGRLGPRVMPDYEILWVERGTCRWEFEGQTQSCPPGTVVICTPGLVDTWYWDPRQTTRHGYLHFDFPGGQKPELPPRRDVAGDDVVRPLLRHAVWLASLGSDEDDRLAERALRQALQWYVEGPATPGRMQAQGAIHPVLKRALRVLHQRWGDGPKVPPSVSDWAVEAGVSRGHLARICRQELDVTPQELLRYLRLDHGLIWLARTNLKIAEISELCGFRTQFHFSRCFKDAYGQSPRDARRQLLAGGDRPQCRVVGLRRLMRSRLTGSMTQLIS